MTRREAMAVSLLWLLGTACGDRPGGDRQAAGIGHLSEVTRVELEELPGDPIVGVEYLSVRPEGGYLLADRFAGRVRLFDESGRQVRVVGRPGEGPGELEEPAAAVELADGSIAVLQRASPRLTVFGPAGPPQISDIPGQYGFWAEGVERGFVAGVATRDTRFAVFQETGEASAIFGTRDPSVASTPFWIYFASDHAAVVGDRVAVNTSLFPSVRIFDLEGDSIAWFPLEPLNWQQAEAPPVTNLASPENRDRLEQWARTFTVVRQIAPVGDSLLVVEYGRHDPQASNPYYVAPTTADVYSVSGKRVGADLILPGPVVGGGERLLVLVAEPPNAWTIAGLEWTGPQR